MPFHRVILDDNDRDNFFHAIAAFQVRKHCSKYINTVASEEELTDLMMKCAVKHADLPMAKVREVFIETMETMYPYLKVALPEEV
jgi:DNA-directed RNA polymerase subunit H (RpoH/RPB5)